MLFSHSTLTVIRHLTRLSTWGILGLAEVDIQGLHAGLSKVGSDQEFLFCLSTLHARQRAEPMLLYALWTPLPEPAGPQDRQVESK